MTPKYFLAAEISNHAACFDISAAKKYFRVKFLTPDSKLVEARSCLTGTFGIFEKSSKTPEEIHFEKNIFAKKIFFASGDFPNMRKVWKKNFDEIFSRLH